MGSYNNYGNNKNTKGNYKNYKRMNKKITDCAAWVTLGCISVVGASLVGVDYINDKKNETSQVKQIEVNDNKPKLNENRTIDIKTDANDLLEEFSKKYTIDDKKEMYNKYYGKMFEVTGKVNRVEYDSTDYGDNIQITNSEPKTFFSDTMELQCLFSQDYDLEKLNIEKGDEIKFDGYFVGTDVRDIEFKSCEIKQINNEIIP